MAKTVCMLIKTSGLEYDDRLRKEIASIRELGYRVHVVALESSNRLRLGNLGEGVTFNCISLSSRRLFPQAKFLIVKVLEMYVRLMFHVVRNRPHAVWIHNIELVGLVPPLALLRLVQVIKLLVWDQHELPADRILKSSFAMWIFTSICLMNDAVVVANDYRRELLVGRRQSLRTIVFVLDNFPDSLFTYSVIDRLPPAVSSFLNGSSYILNQGGGAPGRHLAAVVDAIVTAKRVKLVVVGGYNTAEVDAFNRKYGKDTMHEMVLFTGMVNQMDIPAFIDHALGSIILYEATAQNRLLCAPNRLYQALARSTPVIVGSNPPLKELIDCSGAGLVLRSDGSNSTEIIEAIATLSAHPERFRQSDLFGSREFLWEYQSSIIGQIMRLDQSA